MLVTERDLEIIRYIDSFGYVAAEQIFNRFKISQKRGYRRLHLLVAEGYLQHKRIFIGRPGIYRGGSQGLALICDDPERPHRPATIRVATIEHDLMLVDLASALVQKYGGTWKTERQIWRERGFTAVEAKMHVPDGILTLPAGDGDGQKNQKIAVELELTAKSGQRLEKIIRGYARAAEYTEVWYFVKNLALAEKIREIAQRMTFIKIYLISEVMTTDGGQRYTRF